MNMGVSSAQERIQGAALRLFAERGTTQITVSELAAAAGVARGTVYNNLGTGLTSAEALFEEVATRLTREMDARTAESLSHVRDPAQRLANGMRLFVRRTHDDPIWGRFLVRFGGSSPTVRALLSGGATRDVTLGVELGRFRVRPEQIPSAVAMTSASVLGAQWLVLEGHRTWRDAGTDVASLMLLALGVPEADAQALAASELPPLAPPRGP